MVSLPDGEKISKISSFVLAQLTNVTFGQTDRRNPRSPGVRRFVTKLGVWARGASKKIWDPLLISATVEASNFKFGIQFGFGTGLPKSNV